MSNDTLTAVRITADASSSSGNGMHFFVCTGSDAPPLVCMADNNGFLTVKTLYARGVTSQNIKGVSVDIYFDAQAQGNAIAINLLQPGMVGDYRVIPQAKSCKLKIARNFVCRISYTIKN